MIRIFYSNLLQTLYRFFAGGPVIQLEIRHVLSPKPVQKT